MSTEPSGAPTLLTAQLISATQALAAGQTQTEVVTAVLRPALLALGAIAGAVLLVDEDGQRLNVAGHRGYDPGTLTIWQDGPFDDQVPAADVLRMRYALYFEHAGALKAAYPELERRTGAVAAVASAVLPMFLDGRPLGSLVLDFTEPHTFTDEEKYFLRTLAAQCAIALGRAGHLDQLGQRLENRSHKILEDARAQEAFVAFTEAVGSETDLVQLVKQAITALQGRFFGSSVVYYEMEGDLWRARIWSEDLRPELAAAIAVGLPAATPIFAQVLETRQPVFTDAWDAEREGVELTEEYAAVANYPLLVAGELCWLLSVGLRGNQTWSEADRGLVRAVGRGLNLALERTETARKLALQNAELQARTRALEAFAVLTRDLALSTDPLLLIRRAQEVVMSMLADGSAMYFEPEGDRWSNRVQYGQLHSPELQVRIDAGLPYDEARSLLTTWTTGRPYFQNRYDQSANVLASLVGSSIAATATLPLVVAGMPLGVLVFALFHQRTWSSVDRVLLETAVQSLGLALDRAAKTRTLDEERTALEAFTRFTELVGIETDVQALVRKAITLLVDTCEVDAVYLERDGDLFKATVWSAEFDPTLRARLQSGFPFKQSNLALILRKNTAAFIDHWVNHREAAGAWIEESVHLRAVAGYPVFQGGELQSVLLIGSRTLATWAERDKGILRAVGRSLDLALERALHAQTLDARTQELAASTAELEAFSYSVSHDLRTPVRHMLGFLSLARTALDGKLDERSTRYMDMVEQAGTRMNTLIDAMLNLSHLAQQPLKLEVVDLNALMTQILATLMPDLLTRNIRWEVAELPSVRGDLEALKQVLTQLTENALKFTRTRDPAIIKVWAEDRNKSWGMFMQDNGLGFDQQYQERLFNMFQRLHSQQEAHGTGVGLASVRRLILKHGGQVFAEGEVGKGATFGFTLPKNHRARVIQR